MDRIVSKVILLGHTSKSTLRKTYFGEGFETDIFSALGTDFALKIVQIDHLAQIELQCWDINTKDQFRKLRQKFYKGLSSVILVFDIASESSLFSLDQWFTEICKITNCQNIAIVLLGVNLDSKLGKLPVDSILGFIEEICNSYDIEQTKFSYFETSIESGENIDTCFKQLGKLALQKAQIVIQ